MKRVIIAAITLIVGAVGCSKEQGSFVDVSSDVEALFDYAEISSKTVGDKWEDLDEVGIYMYKTGETLSTYALAKENVKYISDADGEFSIPQGDTPIYYPQSDKVDFYAYYPYQSIGADRLYTADVTLQNSADQGAVDFLVAKLANKGKDKDAVAFTFDHALSKITLTITPKQSLESLSGLVVKLEGVTTKAKFNVLTGEYVSVVTNNSSVTFEKISDESKKVVATVIAVPESLANAKLSFSFASGDYQADSFTAKFPASTPNLLKGSNHTFNVSVGYLEADFTGDCGITEWKNNDAINQDIIDAEEQD